MSQVFPTYAVSLLRTGQVDSSRVECCEYSVIHDKFGDAKSYSPRFRLSVLESLDNDELTKLPEGTPHKHRPSSRKAFEVPITA